MKIYKVGLIAGNVDLLYVQRQAKVEEEVYWRTVCIFEHDKAALYLLQSIVQDIDLSLTYQQCFQNHFFNSKLSYPRIITSSDVLSWLSEQIN